jgi:CheY-like chemotaxis protein
MANSISEKNIILYADDDEDDLLLVKDAFNKYASFIEVVTVGNGNQVLLYLATLSSDDPAPCLIILDINMPLLNGKEVLKKIRAMERFKHVPVVLFSTSTQHYEKKFAEDHNASFIPKPVDMKELERITDKFIDKCSMDIRNTLRPAR